MNCACPCHHPEHADAMRGRVCAQCRAVHEVVTVQGTAGEPVVVRPDDKLVLVIRPDEVHMVERMSRELTARLGKDRWLIVAGNADDVFLAPKPEPLTVPAPTADTIAAERVRKAWTDAGRNPTAHRIAQRQLRQGWPALAAALDNLAPPRAGT